MNLPLHSQIRPREDLNTGYSPWKNSILGIGKSPQITAYDTPSGLACHALMNPHKIAKRIITEENYSGLEGLSRRLKSSNATSP
jgi:hypothetical protein